MLQWSNVWFKVLCQCPSWRCECDRWSGPPHAQRTAVDYDAKFVWPFPFIEFSRPDYRSWNEAHKTMNNGNHHSQMVIGAMRNITVPSFDWFAIYLLRCKSVTSRCIANLSVQQNFSLRYAFRIVEFPRRYDICSNYVSKTWTCLLIGRWFN